MPNKNKNNDKYFSGLTGEKTAKQYMEKLGFVLLKNRFKTKNGEIDLIFKNDNEKLFVFMEVKRRKTIYDYENNETRTKYDRDYENVILKRQWDRIYNASSDFLSKNQEYNEYDLRYDAFICFRDTDRIIHIPNILQTDNVL